MGLHPLKARPPGQLLKANPSAPRGPLQYGVKFERRLTIKVPQGLTDEQVLFLSGIFHDLLGHECANDEEAKDHGSFFAHRIGTEKPGYGTGRKFHFHAE
jgi:hypothetical protein